MIKKRKIPPECSVENIFSLLVQIAVSLANSQARSSGKGENYAEIVIIANNHSPGSTETCNQTKKYKMWSKKHCLIWGDGGWYTSIKKTLGKQPNQLLGKECGSSPRDRSLAVGVLATSPHLLLSKTEKKKKTSSNFSKIQLLAACLEA